MVFFRKTNEQKNTKKATQNMSLEPLMPMDCKPRFLTPDGRPRRGAEHDYQFKCFELFRSFGDFFNFWRQSTPFRLQELDDTQIKREVLGVEIEDIYGHRYDVYYYKYRVGLLQSVRFPHSTNTRGVGFFRGPSSEL